MSETHTEQSRQASRRRILKVLATGGIGAAALGLGSFPEIPRVQASSPGLSSFVTAQIADALSSTEPEIMIENLAGGYADLSRRNEGKTASYTICLDGSMVKALNGSNGHVDYQNPSDALAVFNSVKLALTRGGLIFYQKGTYPFSAAMSWTQGGYNSQAWVVEGEGFATVLSQTNSGLDAVYVHNGTPVHFRNLQIYVGTAARHGFFSDETGSNASGLYNGSMRNVWITGGSNGNYLFNGINVFYSYFNQLNLQSSTAGCNPMRLYQDQASNMNGNNVFDQVIIWANAADALQVLSSGNGYYNLNEFNGLYTNGTALTGHTSLNIGLNVLNNVFTFIDLESADYGIQINGTNTSRTTSNHFLSGYINSKVCCLYLGQYQVANTFKNLNLAAQSSKTIISDSSVSNPNTNVYEDIYWNVGNSGTIAFTNSPIFRGRAGGGLLFENSGTSTGTGSQQTIAHGLALGPKCVLVSEYTTGGALPYQSKTADATNIYITATNGKTYQWIAKD